MPIYEYACQACDGRFEELLKANGPQIAVDCPECGSPDTRRLLSVFAIRGSAPAPQEAVAAPPASGCCGGACGCH